MTSRLRQHLHSIQRSARTTTCIGAVWLVSACASQPPAPDWQANAYADAKHFTQAYLEGQTLLAEQAIARARQAVAQTGRPDRMARLELLRCAVHLASLVLDDCPAYQALAVDALPAETAYAAFLSGRWHGLQAQQLPPAYQAFFKAAQQDAARQAGMSPSHSLLELIEPPLSRLIAAGVLQRRGQLSAPDLQLASDTASQQGWRRALLAWLGRQQQQAQVQGDAAASGRLQRRIDLAAPRTP